MAVEKVRDFLEVKADTELTSAVVERCQFTNTQQDKKEHPDPRFKHYSRDGDQILYRKGNPFNPKYRQWYSRF